eukprot:gene17893-biopygen841
MRFGLPSAGRGLGGRDARLGLPRGVPGIAARACAGAVKRWGLVAAPFANEQFCGSGHKKNEPMGGGTGHWPGHGAGVARAVSHSWVGVVRAWRGHVLFPPGYCPWPARCSPVVRCALPTCQRSGAWAARGCEISAPDDGFFCFFCRIQGSHSAHKLPTMVVSAVPPGERQSCNPPRGRLGGDRQAQV